MEITKKNVYIKAPFSNNKDFIFIPRSLQAVMLYMQFAPECKSAAGSIIVLGSRVIISDKF